MTERFYFIRLSPYEEYLYNRMAAARNMGIIEFMHICMAEGADFLTDCDDLEYLDSDPIMNQYMEKEDNEG